MLRAAQNDLAGIGCRILKLLHHEPLIARIAKVGEARQNDKQYREHASQEPEDANCAMAGPETSSSGGSEEILWEQLKLDS